MTLLQLLSDFLMLSIKLAISLKPALAQNPILKDMLARAVQIHATIASTPNPTVDTPAWMPLAGTVAAGTPAAAATTVSIPGVSPAG